MEKEYVDLYEKLKDAEPDKVHLYSPVFGNVVVRHVGSSRIKCYVDDGKSDSHLINFDNYGRVQAICSDCHIQCWSDEVMLFPSKENRDWNSYVLYGCENVPSTWEEFLKVAKDVPAVEYNGQKVSSQYPRLMTLEKLLLIRDYYNNGWKPDYNNEEWKWQIVCDYNQVDGCRVIGFEKHIPHVLTFKDEKLAEMFLKSFEDMIVEVRELL